MCKAGGEREASSSFHLFVHVCKKSVFYRIFSSDWCHLPSVRSELILSGKLFEKTLVAGLCRVLRSTGKTLYDGEGS